MQNHSSDISFNNPQYSLDLSFNTTNQYGGYKVFHDNIQLSVYTLFNKENIFYFMCFLAIYVIFLYYSFGHYSSSGNDELSAFSNTIDIICIFILIIIFIVYYFGSSREDKENLFGQILKTSQNFFEDPKSILYTILLITVFYITVYICRIPMTKETKPLTMLFIEHNLWLTLIPIIIFDLFKYLFGIDLVSIIFDKIYSIWLPLPDDFREDEIITNHIPVTDDAQKREVFNISNNLYTYDDAQAICKSYDSRLATYNEVEDSYNDGGEWCNYGWSDAQ